MDWCLLGALLANRFNGRQQRLIHEGVEGVGALDLALPAVPQNGLRVEAAGLGADPPASSSRAQSLAAWAGWVGVEARAA